MTTLMPVDPDNLLLAGEIPPRPLDPRDQAVADARELQQIATAQLVAEREQSAQVREEALEHLRVLIDGWRILPALPPDLIRNQVRLAILALTGTAVPDVGPGPGR